MDNEAAHIVVTYKGERRIIAKPATYWNLIELVEREFGIEAGCILLARMDCPWGKYGELGLHNSAYAIVMNGTELRFENLSEMETRSLCSIPGLLQAAGDYGAHSAHRPAKRSAGNTKGDSVLNEGVNHVSHTLPGEVNRKHATPYMLTHWFRYQPAANHLDKGVPGPMPRMAPPSTPDLVHPQPIGLSESYVVPTFPFGPVDYMRHAGRPSYMLPEYTPTMSNKTDMNDGLAHCHATPPTRRHNMPATTTMSAKSKAAAATVTGVASSAQKKKKAGDGDGIDTDASSGWEAGSERADAAVLLPTSASKGKKLVTGPAASPAANRHCRRESGYDGANGLYLQ